MKKSPKKNLRSEIFLVFAIFCFFCFLKVQKMLDRPENRVVRFLSRRPKGTMGKVVFCFTCLRETKRKHFWRKKFSERIFGKNLSKKRQITKQKKVKNGKNGDNKIWLSFSKNEAMNSFFFSESETKHKKRLPCFQI